MNQLESFKQKHQYNVWANAELLKYFQEAAQPYEKAARFFAHLLLAEKIWLQRIRNENSDNTGANFWAGQTIAECAALFDENRLKFDGFFNRLTEEKLASKFTYKNSKGTEFENTVGEALTHVFFHSVYHRGQAAQAIRLAEGNPPATDFIQFLRR